MLNISPHPCFLVVTGFISVDLGFRVLLYTDVNCTGFACPFVIKAFDLEDMAATLHATIYADTLTIFNLLQLECFRVLVILSPMALEREV